LPINIIPLLFVSLFKSPIFENLSWTNTIGLVSNLDLALSLLLHALVLLLLVISITSTSISYFWLNVSFKGFLFCLRASPLALSPPTPWTIEPNYYLEGGSNATREQMYHLSQATLGHHNTFHCLIIYIVDLGVFIVLYQISRSIMFHKKM
jgi:hypothetical protein